jgi:hypothetical protein
MQSDHALFFGAGANDELITYNNNPIFLQFFNNVFGYMCLREIIRIILVANKQRNAL